MSNPASHRLRSEVESPRPLRAPAGRVSLKGWCLLAGHPKAPDVRVVTDAGTLALTARVARKDLKAQLRGEPAAGRCGFLIEGTLPPGVYLARFEARLPDGTWRLFKTLSLVVEPPPFLAAIESPVVTGTVHERVHVEGWAFHPVHQVQELTLRYGHQTIPCDLGRKRRDLWETHAHTPNAAWAGFKSRTILSAGRGNLRLKARLADGSITLSRTLLHIDVATDENHDANIRFGAKRISLRPVPAVTEPRTGVLPARTFNVLFILPGSFASNSALHVAGLANELAHSGHACAVAVSHDLSTLSHHQAPAFRGLLHETAAAGVTFSDGRGPDIIHAWTTRENVRRLSETLLARQPARLIVHLEDHEAEVLSLSVGITPAELGRLPDAELDRLIPADLSHPKRSRDFLARATAVTVITERLRELVPAGLPCHTVWPAADARYFRPQPLPRKFRQLLDRSRGETVLFYHGNVHAANAGEMRELYAAVLELNRSGQPVTLIRTGLDAVDFLGAMAEEVAPHVLSLGQILHHHHLPALMALADLFVQPGQPDAFNDYRFPSKLPEFFALGRPVILPRTNLGTQLQHGIDAYVLDRADAAGIAAAVTELRRDRALYDRLCAGARAFASTHFSWHRSAEALGQFYASLSPLP
jgi:glycosyltransferase involved in cell wall biosynthesis